MDESVLLGLWAVATVSLGGGLSVLQLWPLTAAALVMLPAACVAGLTAALLLRPLTVVGKQASADCERWTKTLVTRLRRVVEVMR